MENSLVAEMMDWNRLDGVIKSSSGKDPLKIREYLKLKLEDFDRMVSVYGGRSLTRDEKAFTIILKYQRAELEKAVYPRLPNRLLRRLIAYFSEPINIKKEVEMATLAGSFSDRDLEMLRTKPDAQEAKQGAVETVRRQQYQSINLGKRKQPRQKRNRGRSV
ncbi:hypothetical protein [Pedobacter borealis]|uniref:hypothetical protein n=1 Tax=Pedobacter borealis TaxID=475254 RepID=UPI0004937D52|nr:hypothetical protein [Pedobacter borealis]